MKQFMTKQQREVFLKKYKNQTAKGNRSLNDLLSLLSWYNPSGVRPSSKTMAIRAKDLGYKVSEGTLENRAKYKKLVEI